MQTYTNLMVGPHTFALKGIDMAGNVQPVPTTFEWEVVP